MTLFYGHKPKLLLNYDNSQISNTILINDPEISQAFYGILHNHVAYYTIEQSKPFEMYLDLSTPTKLDSSINNSFFVNIYWLNQNNYQLIKKLQARNFTKFYEEYGGDTYYRSIILDEQFNSGNYLIEVTNDLYDAKYVLAIGKLEDFSIQDSLEAITSIYIIKTQFFDKSPSAIFEGRIMKTLALVLIFIAIILIILYKVFQQTTHHK